MTDSSRITARAPTQTRPYYGIENDVQGRPTSNFPSNYCRTPRYTYSLGTSSEIRPPTRTNSAVQLPTNMSSQPLPSMKALALGNKSKLAIIWSAITGKGIGHGAHLTRVPRLTLASNEVLVKVRCVAAVSCSHPSSLSNIRRPVEDSSYHLEPDRQPSRKLGRDSRRNSRLRLCRCR